MRDMAKKMKDLQKDQYVQKYIDDQQSEILSLNFANKVREYSKVKKLTRQVSDLSDILTQKSYNPGAFKDLFKSELNFMEQLGLDDASQMRSR